MKKGDKGRKRKIEITREVEGSFVTSIYIDDA